MTDLPINYKIDDYANMLSDFKLEELRHLSENEISDILTTEKPIIEEKIKD